MLGCVLRLRRKHRFGVVTINTFFLKLKQTKKHLYNGRFYSEASQIWFELGNNIFHNEYKIGRAICFTSVIMKEYAGKDQGNHVTPCSSSRKGSSSTFKWVGNWAYVH